MPKSLASRLAQFANPEPDDIDPEDIEQEHSGVDSGSADEFARAHYVDVDKSRLRDDAPEVDAQKYAGKRASRQALVDQVGESESEPSSSEFSESEDGDNDPHVESDPGSETDSSKGKTDTLAPRKTNGHISSASASPSEEDSVEDSDGQPNERTNGSQNGMLSRILQQEEKQLVSRLSSAAQEDAEKGRAIEAQHQTFEGLLDMRIKLQKVLNISNVLQHKQSPEATVALQSMERLVQNILGLRHKLAENKTSRPAKRTLGDLASETWSLDDELSQQREVILTRWSRKIQASSGSQVLQNAKFKSLNQSAAVQVKTVLADMDRLVKRTKLNRSQYKLTDQDGIPEEHDSIYDDTDFYRLLLKDLVDRRMADSSANTGLRWATAKTKSKKNVDNRASKGRKLRYDVQDKVQGFDAPRDVFTWGEEQAEELFTNLLGKKITMDDNVSEDDEAVDEDFAIFS